jgi:hypothetical protein
MDRTKPVVGMSLPAQAAGAVAFTVNGTDPGAVTPISAAGPKISYAEWFVGNAPALGKGTSVPVTDGAVLPTAISYDLAANGYFTPTSLTFTFRAKDAAGNWSQVSRRITTSSLLLFANAFDAPRGTPAGLVSALKPWNTAPSGRTTLVTAGRISGQRSLSVATGVVGYYTENLLKLRSIPASKVHVGFLMAPNRALSLGCATAGSASRCAPRGVTVFSATTSKGAAAVAVQFGRATASSRVQFRLGVLRNTGGTTWGAWTTVKTAKTYDVRVDWASGVDGAATLRVNSSTPLSIVTAANASVRVTAIHVGVLNRVVKARGAILFDSVSIA